jgi:CRP/FNR family cyclic AMP-dependent transcriptional regulator
VRPALTALAPREPLLARNVSGALSERVAMLRATAAVLAGMRLEDRGCSRGLQLAEEFGRATPDGALLDLGLTHAQWGLLVGATRESVTLAFGRLRARGRLIVEGRTVTVPWHAARR